MIRFVTAKESDRANNITSIDTIKKSDQIASGITPFLPIKTEENVLLRYFIWEAMSEQGKFKDPKEEFLCLLSLVFQYQEKNIHELYNRGVFRSAKKTVDAIKIGYPKEVLIKIMQQFNKGEKVAIPSRAKFAKSEAEMKSVEAAIKVLESVSEKLDILPDSELFNRLGGWMSACENNFFSSEVEEITWFIKYVIQEKNRYLYKIFVTKPLIKYSEWLIRKKLQEFQDTGGKITLTPEERLENLHKIVQKESKSLKQESKDDEGNTAKKMAEILKLDENDERIKTLEKIEKSMFRKLENNNKNMTFQDLIEKSSFSISIQQENFDDPIKEISYMYRVIFLPLKKEGFFKDEENAMSFFVYKAAEIIGKDTDFIVDLASQAGIQDIELPIAYNEKAEQYDYSDFFVEDKESGRSYEIYKRFRDSDFCTSRYKIVEDSNLKLYFIKTSNGFKQQKDLHFELRSNAKISKLNSFSLVNNKKESDEHYDAIAKQQSDVGAFSCFMVENDQILDGIGTVELENLDDITRTYNFAYLLKIEYQGKLLGYCMTKAMIDYLVALRLRNEIHPLNILALIHRDNSASKALIRKLNFKQIFGENQESEFWTRGMICNKFLLEI
jgi:RimJ/RimL family protein N-acetyltransferase